MAEERLPLAELLAKSGGGNFLRSVAGAVLQLLIEADARGVKGVPKSDHCDAVQCWLKALKTQRPNMW